MLVDTDVCLDFFKDRGTGAAAMRMLLTQRRATLCAVTVYELYAGATRPERLRHLDALLAQVSLAGISPDVGRRAGTIYTYLRSKGDLIPSHDILIAATALELGMPLVSRNAKHFSRIDGLVVIDPGNLLTTE